MLVSLLIGFGSIVIMDRFIFFLNHRLTPPQRMVYGSLCAFLITLISPLILVWINPDLNMRNLFVTFPFGFQPAGHINEYGVTWVSFLQFQVPFRFPTLWIALIYLPLWTGLGVLGTVMAVWFLYRIKYTVFSFITHPPKKWS